MGDMSTGGSLREGYTRGHRRLEIAAIILFAAAVAVLAGRVAVTASVVELTIGLLVGYLGADLISGIVHWVGDTWGTPEWPVLGPGLIRPFREHHVDPEAITHHDFIETNGNSSLGALVFVFAGLAMPLDDAAGREAAVATAALAVFLFATNEIHQWAHSRRAPRLVAWMQRRRLILAPAVHASHHRSPFDRDYCITTGWLNPWLTRLGFFRGLEALITRLTGALPRA